jgi:hypothetical protein
MFLRCGCGWIFVWWTGKREALPCPVKGREGSEASREKERGEGGPGGEFHVDDIFGCGWL